MLSSHAGKPKTAKKTISSEERERSLDWTNDRVQGYINNLKLYKPSLDLLLGGKKIALCHFGNDIRWDFVKHNTWIYQDNIGNGIWLISTNSWSGKTGISRVNMNTNKQAYNNVLEGLLLENALSVRIINNTTISVKIEIVNQLL